MMPRKPRRSSILKPPKQVVRAPLQDLDSDDEGTLTQPTSRRVSFSRTSQIKEFDPSIGYMTKWNQSYEESLESIEGDENQPKSINVFDGLSGVQTQKKFKRKRTSTLQLSLNSSNIETDGGVCSGQPLHQNLDARARKQPRKALDSFKTEVSEEGDTTLFFDELNLTDPIKSSYSNMDASTNLTRYVDSVFDSSNVDFCQSKIDLSTAHSPESISKSVGNVSKKLNCDGGGTVADILLSEDLNGDFADKCESLNKSQDSANMDCTLTGGKIEDAEIFINSQGLVNQHLGSSSITHSNITNNMKHEIASNTAATITSDKDHDDLLPSLSLPIQDKQLNGGKGHLDENNCLDVSMELTIPQVRYEEALPKRNYQGENIHASQVVQSNNIDSEDLEITGTWGHIVERRDSALVSEIKNVCAYNRGEPESLTNVLVANEECFKLKVADCTVGSDMELSMTYGGVVIQDNMENENFNATQGSDFIDEACFDLDGMDLTVPLGKLKMSKARDDLEKIDSFKPLEANEPLNNPNSTSQGKNKEEGLPKEKSERISAENIVNSITHSEGLDVTCPDIHGMEMTVSLGKIRDKITKPFDENTRQNVGGISDSSPRDECKNELTLVQISQEKKENLKTGHIDGLTSDSELHSHGKAQEINENKSKTGVISKTTELHQLYVEQCGNLVDNSEVCSQLGDKTNPEVVGLDVTVPIERKEENVDPGDSSRMYNVNVNETNPDDMGMELTVPLGKLKGKLAVSRSTVSQMGNVSCSESVGMEKPLSMKSVIEDKCKDSVDNNTTAEFHEANYVNCKAMGTLKGENCEGTLDPLAESRIIDDTNPEATGMEFTVPLGRLRGDKYGVSVDNSLDKSKIIDETIPDAMELTVPLGRLKGEEYKNLVNRMLQQTQMVNDTNPDLMGMELTVPLGRLKGDKHTDPVDSMLQQTQMANDTNPDLMRMELTVPLGRLKGDKPKDPVDSMLQQTQMVNDTNPDLMGMELTVPLGRLNGDKPKDPVDSMLQQTQMVDDTNPDLMGMELTVPLGRLNGGDKPKDPVDSILQQTQMVNDTNPDLMGMELTVPLGRLKGDLVEDCQNVAGSTVNTQVESLILQGTSIRGIETEPSIKETELKEVNASITANLIAESQQVNNTNPNAMGIEMSVPMGSSKGVAYEDLVVESVAECQMVDNTNSEPVGMESTMVAELKGNYTNHADNTIAESNQMSDTNPDDMGMELTVALGRLKGDKYVETGCLEASELQMVDAVDPKVGYKEITAPLVSVENHKNQNSSFDIENGPQAECETSNRGFDVSKFKSKGSILQTDDKYQAMVTTKTNSPAIQLVTPSQDPECGVIVNDIVTKPISEGCVNWERVGLELSYSLRGPDGQEEANCLSNRLSEFKTKADNISRDIPSESKFSFEGCDEKITPEVEEKGVEDQRGEEIIPEQVDIAHSLSDTMGTNNPLERLEAPKLQQNPVHNMVKLKPLDVEHTSSVPNEVGSDSGVIPVSNLEEDKQQIEKNTIKGKIMACVEVVSNTVGLPIESEANKESNVIFDKQIATNSDDTCGEMHLAESFGKLKSHEEVSKIRVSVPSQFNADINKNSSGATSLIALVSENAYVNNQTCAINSEAVPVIDSVLLPDFDNKEHPHDDPSNVPANSLAIASEEVAMDCVQFSDKDSHIDKDCKELPYDIPSFEPVNSLAIASDDVAMDCVQFCERDSHAVEDCMEPMDDTSLQEILESNGIESNCEIKTVHQSELDCSSMDESDENQVAHELSKVEEMREETSSIAAVASDSSTVDRAVNAPIQGESSKPIVSIEDWIKEESKKESCDWAVYKLLENQYSFMVFHEAAVLLVNLKPLLEGQDSKENRIVESVVLKSCITDDNEWCIKVVLNVMLKKLSTSLLSSLCSSTEQLPGLFEFLNAEFLTMNMLLLQTYDLMRGGPVDYQSHGFSFRVPSMKRLLLFEVQINLLNWDKDGIKPDDVKVINIIGKMGVTDIQSVVRSIRCERCYFRNIYNEVLNFVFTLEKVLE